MATRSSKDIRRFNHLVSETDAVYHELSLKLGLSDSAMQILYTIYDTGDDGCLLRDICRLTGLSRQTLHSSVRQLERDGILFLKPEGAKNKKAVLTENGRRLAARTAGKVIEAENHIFASWEKEDVDTYLGLMRRYLEDFRKEIRKIERETEKQDESLKRN
ncbi:MAG: MarR family transcriptional regulator [Lachnospiraceae bacterium]|nr:MarR family transcriptional regulator [Lachnospiraceae bacterium]